MPILRLAVAALGALALCGPACAAILIDQSDSSFRFRRWTSYTNFTARLAAQRGGYTIGSIADSAAVAAADSILVNIRSKDAVLSAQKVANLTGFVASGKRVLLIGENGVWRKWSSSIIGFASGGTATVDHAQFSAPLNPVVDDEITAGAGQLDVHAASLVASGGTSLYDYNVVTLWGTSDNVLATLDMNIFASEMTTANHVFQANVAGRPGAGRAPAVPEPSSWAMLVLGVGGLLRSRRARLSPALLGPKPSRQSGSGAAW